MPADHKALATSIIQPEETLMERTVLQRPIQPLVPEHRVAPDYSRQQQADPVSLFIALGLQPGEPGYDFVMRHVEELGDVAHFNEGLMYVETSHKIDKAFKLLNECLTDPRMDCDTPLVVLDPKSMRAKWYLSLQVSGVLNANWRRRNNLFVCHKAGQDPNTLVPYIQALGVAAPISKTTWYVSCAYSPTEAFKILSSFMDAGDRLTVFDAMGRVKSWQTEPGRVNIQLRKPGEDRPTRATIHKPVSWQAQALAEFL